MKLKLVRDNAFIVELDKLEDAVGVADERKALIGFARPPPCSLDINMDFMRLIQDFLYGSFMLTGLFGAYETLDRTYEKTNGLEVRGLSPLTRMRKAKFSQMGQVAVDIQTKTIRTLTMPQLYFTRLRALFAEALIPEELVNMYLVEMGMMRTVFLNRFFQFRTLLKKHAGFLRYLKCSIVAAEYYVSLVSHALTTFRSQKCKAMMAYMDSKSEQWIQTLDLQRGWSLRGYGEFMSLFSYHSRGCLRYCKCNELYCSRNLYKVWKEAQKKVLEEHIPLDCDSYTMAQFTSFAHQEYLFVLLSTDSLKTLSC